MIPAEFNQDHKMARKRLQQMNEATKFKVGQHVKMIGSLAQQMKREGLATYGEVLTVRQLQGNTHLKVRWSDGGDRGVLGSNVKVVKEGLQERAQIVHSDWQTGEVFYKLASADEREQFEDQARWIKGATFKNARWPGKQQNVYVFAIKGKGPSDTSELLRKRMFPSLWRGPLPKDNVKVEGVNEEYLTEKVSIVAADNRTGEVILKVVGQRPSPGSPSKEETRLALLADRTAGAVFKPVGSRVSSAFGSKDLFSFKVERIKKPEDVAKLLRKELGSEFK